MKNSKKNNTKVTVRRNSSNAESDFSDNEGLDKKTLRKFVESSGGKQPKITKSGKL